MRRDGTGKCPVKWYIDELGKKRWVCFAHLAPYHRHHESSEQCWYTTCPGRSMVGYPLTPQELEERKAEQARKKIKENEQTIHQVDEPKSKPKSKPKSTCSPSVCDNYGCENQIATGRKRYCSDKCRLQKSRADYEARNPNRKHTHKVKQDSEDKKDIPVIPPQPVAPEEGICTSITCSNVVPSTRRAYCSEQCRKRAYVQRKRGLLKG